MAIALALIGIALVLFCKIPHLWKFAASCIILVVVFSNITVERFGGLKRTCVFGQCETTVDESKFR